MLAPRSLATAILFAAATTIPTVALAQSAPVDLSGTWTEASGGTASFARASGDTYRVRWSKSDGTVVEGTATFDGARLSVRLENAEGASARVAEAFGGSAPAAAPGASAYGYRSGSNDPYERLDIRTDGGGAIAGGGELRRQKPGALSAPVADGAFGDRAQIEATRELVRDAEGNGDGIVGNEGKPAGSLDTPFFSMQPFLDRIRLWLEPGLSTADEKKELTDFVAARERAWGQPVTQLSPESLPDMGRFRAEKAAELTRFGRTPADVTEGFLDARGSVDGRAIAPRQVFWQRWKPIGTPNGKVVVVSPGFQETGREFIEQANALDELGYDVILMDHQWSGYTTSENRPGWFRSAEATVAGFILGPGEKRAVLDDAGGIDRGYGVARDVAAVAARAAQVCERDYGSVPGHRVILVGNSMGAGPGVLGALTLNDAGLLHLEGPAMPRGLDAVLEAPFIQMTPSLLNKAVALAAHVPGVSGLELPSAGLPVLSHDAAANEKFSNHAGAEDVRAQLHSMIAATADLGKIRALVDAGRGPAGRIYVIHADHDPLADPAGSRWLVSRLGARGKLDLIAANDHVLEESPTEQGHLLDGMRWIAAK